MNLPQGCVVGNARPTRANQGRFPQGVIFDDEGGGGGQPSRRELTCDMPLGALADRRLLGPAFDQPKRSLTVATRPASTAAAFSSAARREVPSASASLASPRTW